MTDLRLDSALSTTSLRLPPLALSRSHVISPRAPALAGQYSERAYVRREGVSVGVQRINKTFEGSAFVPKLRLDLSVLEAEASYAQSLSECHRQASQSARISTSLRDLLQKRSKLDPPPRRREFLDHDASSNSSRQPLHEPKFGTFKRREQAGKYVRRMIKELREDEAAWQEFAQSPHITERLQRSPSPPKLPPPRMQRPIAFKVPPLIASRPSQPELNLMLNERDSRILRKLEDAELRKAKLLFTKAPANRKRAKQWRSVLHFALSAVLLGDRLRRARTDWFELLMQNSASSKIARLWRARRRGKALQIISRCTFFMCINRRIRKKKQCVAAVKKLLVTSYHVLRLQQAVRRFVQKYHVIQRTLGQKIRWIRLRRSIWMLQIRSMIAKVQQHTTEPNVVVRVFRRMKGGEEMLKAVFAETMSGTCQQTGGALPEITEGLLLKAIRKPWKEKRPLWMQAMRAYRDEYDEFLRERTKQEMMHNMMHGQFSRQTTSPAKAAKKLRKEFERARKTCVPRWPSLLTPTEVLACCIALIDGTY